MEDYNEIDPENKVFYRFLVNMLYEGFNIKTFSEKFNYNRRHFYKKYSRIKIKHFDNIIKKVKESKSRKVNKKDSFQSFMHKYKEILEYKRIKPLGRFKLLNKSHSWNTPHGVLKIKPSTLIQNKFDYSVRGFNNKLLYYKKDLEFNNLKLYNEIKSWHKIEDDYLYVSTVYGEAKISVFLAKKMKKIDISSYIDRKDYLNNFLKIKKSKLVVKEVLGNRLLLVEDLFGECTISENHLLRGTEPKIGSAVDKNSYCINQFNKVHNFKYDYSLVKYKDDKSVVKIICKDHGVFKQSVRSHKNGSGCIKCAKEASRKRCLLYNTRKIEGKKEKYKGIDSGLYAVSFTGFGEYFTKIGISNNIERRLSDFRRYKYNVKLITYEKCSLYEALLAEKMMLNSKCNIHYEPIVKFPGYTECILLQQDLENLGEEKALSEEFLKRMSYDLR